MTTRFLATLALVAYCVQAAAFAATHALATGYDPMVNFVSEYALGPYSWIRRIGAAGLIVGTLALLGALRSAGLARGRSAASMLLTLNVVLLLVAQVFPVDGVAEAFADGGPPHFTATGWIHVISGLIAAVAVLVAIVLLTLRLRRLGQLRGAYRLLILLSATGPAAYALMMVTPPATSPAGLYQRLFIVSAWLWQVVASEGLRSGTLTGAPVDPRAQ